MIEPPIVEVAGLRESVPAYTRSSESDVLFANATSSPERPSPNTSEPPAQFSASCVFGEAVRLCFAPHVAVDLRVVTNLDAVRPEDRVVVVIGRRHG